MKFLIELSGCNSTQTHNHLVPQQTLNNLGNTLMAATLECPLLDYIRNEKDKKLVIIAAHQTFSGIFYRMQICHDIVGNRSVNRNYKILDKTLNCLSNCL